MNPDCKMYLNSCKFEKNVAGLAGGAIKWNDRPIVLDALSTFTGNTAVYGANVGSYAICLVKTNYIPLLNNRTDARKYNNTVCYSTEMERGREIVTRFEMDEVASGQPAENLNFTNSSIYLYLGFALVDHYDNLITYDNTSKVIVFPVTKLTKDNTGWDSIYVINNERFAF